MDKNLEVEVKFAIRDEVLSFIKSIFEKIGIIQWYYTKNSRIRVYIKKDKEVWEKTTKIDKIGEDGVLTREEVNSEVNENDKKNLKSLPIVAKYRYYLDFNKTISVDDYMFPKRPPIMEIELNEEEIVEYQKTKNLYKVLKKKLSDILSEKMIKKIVKKENDRTSDKSYKNANIAMLADKDYYKIIKNKIKK